MRPVFSSLLPIEQVHYNDGYLVFWIWTAVCTVLGFVLGKLS